MHVDDWDATLDRLAALGELAPSTSYRSSAGGRLEGRWVGRYLTTVLPEPVWMSVDLRTTGAGEAVVRGAGEDPVGAFSMEGWHDAATGEFGLEKDYVGAHSLRYAGHFDGVALRGAYSFGGADGGLFALRREAELPESTLRALPRLLARRHWRMNLHALWYAFQRSRFAEREALHRRLRARSPRLDRWLAGAQVWRTRSAP